MANFILIGSESKEQLLNLDTVISIVPYYAAYDAEEDDVDGVLITFINNEEPVLYEGLNFNDLKDKMIDK